MIKSALTFLVFFTMVFASSAAPPNGSNLKAPHSLFDYKKASSDFDKGLKKVPVDKKLPFLFLNEKQQIESTKQLQNNSRKVAAAQTDVTKSAIEATFKNKKDFLTMRTELIGDGADNKGVWSKEELDRIVKKYSDPKEFKALKSPEAIFLALQIRALKPFKSFIFRAREYIKKNSATRLMIVSALRGQIASITHFYPSGADIKVNFAEVVFEYVTEPFSDMEPAITQDVDLYNFMLELTNYTHNEMETYRTELAWEGTELWWDNRLYLPFANFINEKDQYAKIGYAEHMAIYSGISLNVSRLYATTAYYFDGLEGATGLTSELYGVDMGAFFSSLGAEGMTSENKFSMSPSANSVFQKVPNLFKAADDVKDRMTRSYDALRAGIETGRASYDAVRSRSAGDQALFESRFVNPFAKFGDKTVRNMSILFGGDSGHAYKTEATAADNDNFSKDKANKSVRSMIVNGDVIKVDLKSFYLNPPAHLNELFPQAWNNKKAGQEEDEDVTAWGKNDVLRNYKYGMATEWNLKPYQKLFPELKPVKGNANRTKEVGKYISILSQTWGGGPFAFPLTFFVL